MINLRNSLLKTNENKDKVDDLNKDSWKLEVEVNRNKIMDNLKSYSDNPENINLTQMWKTLRKLWPKCGASLPSAKRNHKGRLITKKSY